MIYVNDDEVLSVEPMFGIRPLARVLAQAAVAEYRRKRQAAAVVPVSAEARRALQEVTLHERFDEELAQAAIDEL